MSFTTWTSPPPFPVESPATRVQIGVYWVDYTGTLPTLAMVKAQAEPTQAQQDAALNVARVAHINEMNWQDVRCYVSADIATTVIAMQDASGMGFAVGLNEVWQAEFKLFCLGSAAGLKLQLTGPANPVRAVIGFRGNTTSTLLWNFNPKASPAYGSPSIAFIVNATPFTGMVEGWVQVVNGSNVGMVQLQVASATAGQTNKILAGSFGAARRVA